MNLSVLLYCCIDYVDIAWRFSARRRQTRVRWWKQAIFLAKCVNISKTVWRYVKSYMT